MPRPRRKPYSPPPQGDTGPDTPAQRNGAVVLQVVEAGVTYRRKRTDHVVITMAKRGHLTRRQAAAGILLSERWEDTMRSPDCAWTRVYVDSSPRPGDVSLATLSAAERWAEVSQHIPRSARGVVVAVCCYCQSLLPGFTRNVHKVHQYRKQLQAALDRVADGMRI